MEVYQNNINMFEQLKYDVTEQQEIYKKFEYKGVLQQ